MSEVYDLKWNKFHANASESFNNLRLEESFTDVTLVSKDHFMIKAHKLVLSASSQYFYDLLKVIPASTPFICLDGVSSSDLKFLVEYIYHGEIKVPNDSIKKFLLLAKRFLVKGLFKENEIQNMKLFKIETNELEEDKIENQASAEEHNKKIIEQNNGESLHNLDPHVQNISIESVNTENEVIEKSSNLNEYHDGQNNSKTNENDIVEGLSDINEEMQAFTSVEAVKVKRKRNFKVYLDGMEVNMEILNSKLNEMIRQPDNTNFGYQCTECNFLISHNSSHIKEHVEKHVENLCFVCKLCGYQTKKRVNLRRDPHKKQCGGSRALYETWPIEKIQLKI